ncbi:MAG: YciI family protein [Polyangiales bacterium]
MRFMLFIKSEPTTESGAAPGADTAAALAKYNAELTKAGVLLATEGFAPSAVGARINYADGHFSTKPGPFAPADRQIAGFWLIQTKSKDEAIEWAKRCPVGEGEIEIRQVYEVEDFPVAPTAEAGDMRDREQGTPPRAPVVAANSGKSAQRKPFVTLLKADHHSETALTPAPNAALLREMGALMEETVQAGALLGGEGLKPSAVGARVRFSAGKPRLFDGPFAETHELVAGYALILAGSLDEALGWARRCLDIHVRGTGVEYGAIEVRALREH